MTAQEALYTFLLGGGGAGGALGLWALVAKFAQGRMRLADRRSEIEIAGEEAEQKARIAVVEAQRRTVERVAETQERLVGAVEMWASSYRVIADHAKSVNDRLDRIEDAMGIKRGSAVPVPPSPPPRAPNPSSPGAPAEAHPPRQ